MDVEDQLRELVPQVLGALVRRYGRFDTAEDAVQEALLAAAQQWPGAGVPENPRGWLITVASRRLTDLLRREQARQQREDRVASWAPQGDPVGDTDDTLVLLFLCCHPSLSPASQIALTLRAVGGLTTAEIARAFLVPEATMTRRITRAKTSVKESGARFTLPADREERLGAVLQVVYLIFNEGYASTTGPRLQRVELAAEGIRLARMLYRLLPDDAEVAGLLALLLLTDARRPARTGPLGELVPMAEQDRSRWIPELIREGVDLITATLPHGPVGPYQLQAAIAAVHDESPSADKTDWPQIVALYEVLLQLTDNPMVALNHVVAVAMARGPAEGLQLLSTIETDDHLAKDHRLSAVRAHLLEMSGDKPAARAAYEEAAARTTSLPQQRYLHARANNL
ncbi:RNA polymerase sigma factor (sigma-70 family) [Kribbella aluminosa]|uniref:RNA polymerase sigma factor (Sigma-70 family) n=1 Tax=Kribbella aluminosa TaxID=416017 RepID=A0ABS4UHS6_9ACTN|nr:sigma-70 family RNA polymerase sigma factor [Kribbella aluminosa]MBP2351203.1 RNA polymerase sigma factor (sigma-70 family) [Kribbella aluminosa]